MTESATIARPYAKAAFEYAKDHNAVENWSAHLQLAAAVLGDERLQGLINSPRLTREQKAELVINICRDQLDKGGVNFIKLLAENDRLSALSDIADEFERQRAELESTIDAILIAAKPTSEAQLEKISQALEKRLGRKVYLQTEIDESLIGGAVIRAGDMVIDGSVKNQLTKLSSALLY